MGTFTASALHPAATARINAPAGIGWLLWSLAAALPWLLPTHSAPWTTFYGDLATAAAMLAPGLWLLWRARGAWPVGATAAAFAALSVLPLLQAAGGRFAYPAEAWVVTMFLAGAALAALVAGRAEVVAPGRLVEALWAGLVVAAFASTGLALYQWAGLHGLGMMVLPPGPGERLVANLGQPNLLASLLVWGLVGLWWGQVHRRLSGPVAFAAAAFLLLGLAATQSRTGWLALAVLAAVAVGCRRMFGGGRSLGAFVALGLWFVLLAVAWTPLSEAIGLAGGRPAGDQAAVGRRPAIWALMLQASTLSPWWGHGWNQGVAAQLAVAPDGGGLHLVVQHAHNVLLDLVVWNGWPLGLAIAASVFWWFVRLLRRVREPADVLMLVALATFGVHAMLELPHCLFLFLGPAAVFAGTLDARHPLSWRLRLPVPAAAAMVLAGLTAAGALLRDYVAIEADHLAWRIRAARIGDLTPPPAVEPWLLHALQQALVDIRTPPRRGMPEEELAALARAATRHPSDGALFAHARAAALNGRFDEAALAWARLCGLHRPAICQAAAAAWQERSRDGEPELARVATPPGFVPMVPPADAGVARPAGLLR